MALCGRPHRSATGRWMAPNPDPAPGPPPGEACTRSPATRRTRSRPGLTRSAPATARNVGTEMTAVRHPYPSMRRWHRRLWQLTTALPASPPVQAGRTRGGVHSSELREERQSRRGGVGVDVSRETAEPVASRIAGEAPEVDVLTALLHPRRERARVLLRLPGRHAAATLGAGHCAGTARTHPIAAPDWDKELFHVKQGRGGELALLR